MNFITSEEKEVYRFFKDFPVEETVFLSIEKDKVNVDERKVIFRSKYSGLLSSYAFILNKEGKLKGINIYGVLIIDFDKNTDLYQYLNNVWEEYIHYHKLRLRILFN